jgi:hypothetical protein
MTHDEAENFLAHYGKKGMKWGQRAANPLIGERGTIDRDILNARAKYEAQNPGLKANLKSAKFNYKQNKTSENKQAITSIKKQRQALDAETYMRSVDTGRETVRDLIIAVGLTGIGVSVVRRLS